MSSIKMDEEMKRSKTVDLDETHPRGLAGKSARITVNLTEEEAYWKEKYKTQAYYNEGREYDDYATAFHYGWESAAKPENAGRKFEEIEPELERDWPSHRSSNDHTWQDFKDAVRDAYNRIQWPK
ncbi:MAG TPA: hypothetical protein VLH08_12120 [Acidobacteriota bacterium]|nr:hypothetical protein [Acidobacteriota bacterium]